MDVITAPRRLRPAGRPGRRARAGLLAVVALLAALVLAGCAAGRDAQTAYQRPTLDGTEATLGTISLGALTIQSPVSTFYAKGSSAPMRLVLVNSGTSADRLTGVTSPSFTGWGSVPSAEASAAPAQSPIGSQQVPIAADSRVAWGTPDSTLVLLLTKFLKPAYPGSSVPITFTFAKAGAITVQVPVGLTEGPNDSVVPSVAGASG